MPSLGQTMLGEEGIIQRYFAPLAAGYPGAHGLRDDAAVVAPPPGHDLVVTVDAVAAGVHFFPDDTPADIGWKALAVNVSDLVAKGATPHAYVMSLAFPEPPSADWLAGFASGLAEAQAAFGLHLIGGDTDRRSGPVAITITAFGFVPTGAMCRRGAARAGDIIFVSGTLGDSALGLRVRGGQAEVAAWGLSDDHRAHLVARYLRPLPRVALAPVLIAHACAAMDISDGLLKDLGRMAAASGVGATVQLDELPLSAAARYVLRTDLATWRDIAAGGDDYEVLACVAPERAALFLAAAKAVGVEVQAIGRVNAGRSLELLDRVGQPVQYVQMGYDHF
jgi:thiamine-monophosphate kinase